MAPVDDWRLRHVESGWTTRERCIDPRLDAAGWRLAPPGPAPAGPYRTEEHATASGPADYALCVGDHVLAVVEAKKLTIGPQNSLTQTERYSRGLTGNPFLFRGFHVPFLYAINGEVLWFHNVRHPLNRSRQVAGFHEPAAPIEIPIQAFDVIVADECHRGYAAAEQSVRRGKPGCPGRWRWKGLTSGGGG
jgi:type I restriction enzyme R subunit